MKKLALLVLLSGISTSSYASLIGRVNAYYNPSNNAAIATTQEKYNDAQKNYLELSRSGLDIEQEQEFLSLQEKVKRRDFDTLNIEMQELNSRINILEGNIHEAEENKETTSTKEDVEEWSQHKKNLTEQRDNLKPKLLEAKKLLTDAEIKLAVINKRTPPTQGEIDAARKLAESFASKLQKQLEENILYSDKSGVVEATLSDFMVSTTTGGAKAIDATVYQYSIPTRRSRCIGDTRLTMFQDMFSIYPSGSGPVKDCPLNDLRNAYSLVPMYIMFHKTVVDAQTPNATDTSVSKTTLSNDLLNNETGALFNIKFTPSIWEDSREDPYTTHISVISDLGYKHIEQPASDLSSIDYVGAGYLGLGINFEFSVFGKSPTKIDLSLKNKKPEGHIALGIGYYRNTVGSSVNNALFQTPVPKYFSSVFVGGEIQITNAISAVFSRSLPKISGENPLGSYTAISIKAKID
ncbi:MAG: hypothetical protein PHH36_11250 [Sideroxydans sp.]|nr:hypothetical protein [Sideroxydans sp.]